MDYKQMLSDYQEKVPALKTKLEELEAEMRRNCKMGRIPDSEYEMKLKKAKYNLEIAKVKAALSLYKQQIKLLKEKIKELDSKK